MNKHEWSLALLLSSGMALPGCSPTLDIPGDAARIGGLVATSGSINDAVASGQPVPNGPARMVARDKFKCTAQTYDLATNPDHFVALNPNADALWPGSLVQGKSMAGGVLDPIPVHRAPGTVTLAVSSGSKGQFSRVLDQVSLSQTTQAINDILAGYGGGTPAKFSYQADTVYSAQHMALKMNANVKWLAGDVAAKLSFSDGARKSRVLVQFTQEYYTMAFQPPQGAAETFARDVTADDLRPYVGPGNPPVYLSGVTYGRIFYLLFESDASVEDLEASVRGSFNIGVVQGGVGLAGNYQSIINRSTVKAYGLGGSAEDAIKAVTGYAPNDPNVSLMDQVKKFLVTGATFDKNNIGVPISYTIRYLNDSSQVRLALTTHYDAEQCVPIPEPKPPGDGCDGVPGSGKVLDACGECGGDGSSCAPCRQKSVKHSEPNGEFVIFHLEPFMGESPGTREWPTGTVKGFQDGSHYTYNVPLCRRIQWNGVRFQCKKGDWVMDPTATFFNDANCFGDRNDGPDNHVSCGAE